MLENLNPTNSSSALSANIDIILEQCNDCDRCLLECSFLTQYGTPGSIAKKYHSDVEKWAATSYRCSLCGLCSSVCPKKLDPSAMFLEFRRNSVNKGLSHFPEHQRLINYEKKGTSQKYTLYALPENCDTIFFPGCSFAGTRPANTLKTYQYLQNHIDSIGIILDCCTLPSHDLGRQKKFETLFFELKTYLLDHGIHTIIVVCPSCHKIFRNYAPGLTIKTAYESILSKGLDIPPLLSETVIVHDPCPARFETETQNAVRSLIKATGLKIIDTPHNKEKTYCCGEGGAVGCLSPDLSMGWTNKRVNESNPHKIITYCAGCVNMLSRKTKVIHVLDLIFDPKKAMSGKARVSGAPLTYLNRLKLKKRLKHLSKTKTRERVSALKNKKALTGGRTMVILSIIATITALSAYVIWTNVNIPTY
jgi:Fe-S oxidoreductase